MNMRKEKTVNENELQDALKTLLEEVANVDDEERAEMGIPDEVVLRVRTFADEGLLTGNAGLVVTAKDGSEFQITIVRSR
jgi:hypothetical protein